MDARAEVHASTKTVQVAGANLFCRDCVEKKNAAAAATDDAWNDGDDKPSFSGTPTTQPLQPEADAVDVADNWDDSDDDAAEENNAADALASADALTRTTAAEAASKWSPGQKGVSQIALVTTSW